MTEITSRFSTALADRCKSEHELGAGGMAPVYSRRKLPPFDDIEAARDWLVEQASGEERGGSG